MAATAFVLSRACHRRSERDYSLSKDMDQEIGHHVDSVDANFQLVDLFHANEDATVSEKTPSANA